MSERERSDGSARLGAFHHVARLVRRVADLPTVPMRDWLDRMAGALSESAGESICVALTARLDPQGAMLVLTRAGVGGSATPERTATLMAAARRLGHAGLAPRASGVVVRAGMSGPWAASGLGRAMGSSTVAGVATIKGDWCLLAYVASAEDQLTTAAVLEAVLPLAASVAERALGPAQSSGLWLTRREQDVLELVVRGLSDREAGAVLGRSPHTVHEHVKSLHQKLGTRRRAELAARYYGGTTGS